MSAAQASSGLTLYARLVAMYAWQSTEKLKHGSVMSSCWSRVQCTRENLPCALLAHGLSQSQKICSLLRLA